MAKHSTRPAEAPPRDLPDADTLRPDLRERRDRVVDAAARMMLAEDYLKIQIKDIAVEADVALGTLYRYFNSKDHVMACALLQWASGFGVRIEYGKQATTLDKVKSVYRRAARAFEREPRVFDVLTHLQSSQDPHAAAVFTEFTRQQTDAFAAALADISPEERADIVNVMSAVLAESLRGQQTGMLTFAQVQARITRAAELILGEHCVG